MEEHIVGMDFREKMRAIYGEKQFDCEVVCDNGASFATSFSRHNIESGVGSDVSFKACIDHIHTHSKISGPSWARSTSC